MRFGSLRDLTLTIRWCDRVMILLVFVVYVTGSDSFPVTLYMRNYRILIMTVLEIVPKTQSVWNLQKAKINYFKYQQTNISPNAATKFCNRPSIIIPQMPSYFPEIHCAAIICEIVIFLARGVRNTRFRLIQIIDQESRSIDNHLVYVTLINNGMPHGPPHFEFPFIRRDCPSQNVQILREGGRGGASDGSHGTRCYSMRSRLTFLSNTGTTIL